MKSRTSTKKGPKFVQIIKLSNDPPELPPGTIQVQFHDGTLRGILRIGERTISANEKCPQCQAAKNFVGLHLLP